MPIGAPNYETLARCENATCSARSLCEMPKGSGESFSGPDASVGCDYYYPVADLRGEGLRDNPGNNYQFDARTKRLRKATHRKPISAEHRAFIAERNRFRY